MVLMCILIGLVDRDHMGWHFWFTRLAVSLFYLHNLVYGQGSAFNGVAWSLEVEIQFYCMAPLLAFVFALADKVSRRTLLVGTILVAILVQSAFLNVSRVHLSIAGEIQFFLIGFLIADFYLNEWKEGAASRSALWDLGALAIVPFALLDRGVLANFVTPFLILALCCAAFRGVLVHWILTRPILTTTGGMCYTLYLYHFPVIVLLMTLTHSLFRNQNPILYYFIQFGFTVIALAEICVPLFAVIERPCMRTDWTKRLSAKLGFRTGAVEGAAAKQRPAELRITATVGDEG
jgi:peptidoglycan/LPS O-acetylase OafA/YrhL